MQVGWHLSTDNSEWVLWTWGGRVEWKFIFRLSSPDGQNENFTVRHNVDDQNPQLSSVENCLICLESGACLLLPEGKGQLPVLTTCEGGAGGWKWVVEKSRRVQVIHLQSLPGSLGWLAVILCNSHSLSWAGCLRHLLPVSLFHQLSGFQIYANCLIPKWYLLPLFSIRYEFIPLCTFVPVV